MVPSCKKTPYGVPFPVTHPVLCFRSQKNMLRVRRVQNVLLTGSCFDARTFRCLFSASLLEPDASLKFPIFIIGVRGASKIVFKKVGQWFIFQEDKFEDTEWEHVIWVSWTSPVIIMYLIPIRDLETLFEMGQRTGYETWAFAGSSSRISRNNIFWTNLNEAWIRWLTFPFPELPTLCVLKPLTAK